MSKFRVEHIKTFTELSLNRGQLRTKLTKTFNANETLYLWDYNFWYVSHKDWGKIFDDVLMSMPKYTIDKFDCEDFAFLVTARILEKYRLNTCGICVGQSPLGKHGFNIFLSEKGLFYLEPQTGEVYPISGDSGYHAEIIIIG